ncbi:NAD(P)-dependent oxidoreductase [Leucobacter rhizosphaerae]|uniref:NAD(P)-dependent oxidoreductase n=1 Tax=Leucobacter rhizosphaerae TaxID=2932245 RepID=A0ABY4FVJ1_9MICO|nr:NAD(P)-dependent oxidoreductase [Leucobacter rhizosphaerae]UOQ60297.1 NAD(P)-dependent oxidoreductase [Leucobacter rhizosphaerae]
MHTPLTRVGFIGLGVMGEPMASNIAASGTFDLALFDVDTARAAELAARLGVSAVADIAGLADRDVIVTMLPTSAIVRGALLDDTGRPRIPAAPGTVFVDMSSSDPLETVETGRLLAEAGYALVDAPVSGARERAMTGTLAIMLGADDDAAAERAIPVIDTMSSRIFRTGGLGTGDTMKALNNFVAAAAFTAASEALIAGQDFGLDPAVMTEIFNASTGQSFVTTHVLPDHVVGGAYGSGFALPLFTKDVRIAQRVQQAANRSAPVCDAVTGAMGDALEALGNVDHTHAFEFWRDR